MVDAFELRPDGTVVGLYTDAIDLRVLGHVRAERASVVEWDEATQAWRARIFATGEMLGPFRRHDERPDLPATRPDRCGARARGPDERRRARGQARGDHRLVPPAPRPPSGGLLRAAMPDSLDSRTAGRRRRATAARAARVRGLLQCRLRLVEAGARALDDPVATEEGCRRMRSHGVTARGALSACVFFLVLAIHGAPTPARSETGGRRVSARVVRVIDGDTLVAHLATVRSGLQNKERVRLVGIDCPESKQ